MLFGVPKDVWRAAIVGIVIGILILLSPNLLKLWHWFKEVTENYHRWEEIVRDIGIAFIVAGIVSFMYEWSTRTTAEHQKIEEVLGLVMATQITKEVWDEVNREVLHRLVLRRNLKFSMRLFPDGKFSGEEDITLPINQAVLWTDSSYELYGLKTGNPLISVKHYLDYHMRDGHQKIPRFEEIGVIKPGEHQAKIYKGADLISIIDTEKGCFSLEGKDGIRLPHLDKKQPATIQIKRYEIINIPGIYTLVMPEMVVPAPTTANSADPLPTITLTLLEQVPGDIEVEVYTWFPTHEFRYDSDKRQWTFFGVMLPGQGFSVVFKRKNMSDVQHSNPATLEPAANPPTS